MPTRYSARHVGRKMRQRLILHPLRLLLFLLLLSFREAAVFIHAEAVISCKALQESAHTVALFLNGKQEVTSIGRKQDMISLYNISK